MSASSSHSAGRFFIQVPKQPALTFVSARKHSTGDEELLVPLGEIECYKPPGIPDANSCPVLRGATRSHRVVVRLFDLDNVLARDGDPGR